MTPRDKYGAEFFCQPFTFKKADGSAVDGHDIGVCILPKDDPSTTLAHAWKVFQELAEWVCEEFKSRPATDTYRIVVGWSRKVRKQQGHIFKTWTDLEGLRKVVECITPEDYAKRFGAGWTPFRNWQKDVQCECEKAEAGSLWCAGMGRFAGSSELEAKRETQRRKLKRGRRATGMRVRERILYEAGYRFTSLANQHFTALPFGGSVVDWRQEVL